MRSLTNMFVLAVAFGLFSCEQDDVDATQPEPQPDPFEVQVIDISSESEMEYMVIAENGSRFVTGSQNGHLVAAFATEGNQPLIPVTFDEDGYPDKVYIDGYLVQFDGFEGSSVNISIINPDQSIEVYRDIETGTDWSKPAPAGIAQLGDGIASRSMTDRTEVLQWISYGLGGVQCALSVAGAVSSGGLAAPLAVLTCGGLAAQVLLNENPDLVGEAAEIVGLKVTTLSAISSALGCAFATTGDIASATSCILGAVNVAIDVLNHHNRFLTENPDIVRIGDGVLRGNSGDVQVTLTWNSTDDIDLHVWDPNGEHIWWKDKFAHSGGQLDIDDVDGYGPENVFFPANFAPSGNYQVGVHHYEGAYDTEYQVIVYAFDRVRMYSGTLSPNEYHDITDFDQNGIYMGNRMQLSKEFLLTAKQ